LLFCTQQNSVATILPAPYAPGKLAQCSDKNERE
jgi:hypothetical protein